MKKKKQNKDSLVDYYEAERKSILSQAEAYKLLYKNEKSLKRN